MLRPVEQVAQGIKKEGEPFGFSLLIALWFVLLTLTYHIRNQEGFAHKPAGNGTIIALWLNMEVSHCFNVVCVYLYYIKLQPKSKFHLCETGKQVFPRFQQF
jgi:hypothetical protein